MKKDANTMYQRALLKFIFTKLPEEIKTAPITKKHPKILYRNKNLSRNITARIEMKKKSNKTTSNSRYLFYFHHFGVKDTYQYIKNTYNEC